MACGSLLPVALQGAAPHSSHQTGGIKRRHHPLRMKQRPLASWDDARSDNPTRVAPDGGVPEQTGAGGEMVGGHLTVISGPVEGNTPVPTLARFRPPDHPWIPRWDDEPHGHGFEVMAMVDDGAARPRPFDLLDCHCPRVAGCSRHLTIHVDEGKAGETGRGNRPGALVVDEACDLGQDTGSPVLRVAMIRRGLCVMPRAGLTVHV